jgi:hypothetical protein
MLNTELIPEILRDLSIDPSLHPRGLAHLSAASGLTRVKGRLFVVADGEFNMGLVSEEPVTADQPAAPISLVRLFEGNLPHDPMKRRLAKPDLETLCALPPLPGCPHGALLALPSGANMKRETGVLIALDAQGGVTERLAHINLAALYDPLRKRLDDLNIEGVFLASGELRLLQRGNRGNAHHPRNACITYDWALLAPWLVGQSTKAPPAKSIRPVVLGDIDGVPLNLTDGAALPGGGWAFCAVAENNRRNPKDGPCAGSAVGVVGPEGKLRQMHWLQGGPKVEGVVTEVAEDNSLVLTLVTDADNAAMPAQLLRVTLPYKV